MAMSAKPTTSIIRLMVMPSYPSLSFTRGPPPMRVRGVGRAPGTGPPNITRAEERVSGGLRAKEPG
jgi:hypothetical protein